MSLISRITALANAVATDIKNKQNLLVNETNIKSINNNNVLGFGKLTVLGNRTFVFGGTGVPGIGNNLTPLVSTNFGGILKKWRFSCKNAPTGGSFVIKIFSSTSEELTNRTELITATIVQNTKTITGDINIAINADVFLTLDVISVNDASDWKFELRQDEA